MKKYLAIDYGSKKIGVAVSDAEGKFAFPFSIILNKNNEYIDNMAYKKMENDKEILVIEQSDLDNSMPLDEIGTLVTKGDLIKDDREYLINRCEELKNNKLVLSGITEDGFLELANTIRNLAKNQPPIILYGCKGEK